ncbi:MAG: radical SAM protein [Candidatus Omnitrophota bacterium]|nr:radical SAM protein [Candidatus Omnitrophota bacterium]
MQLENKINIIKHTNSFCPVCLAFIEAKITENEDKVYLESYCPQHGSFRRQHKWDDLYYYNTMNELTKHNIKRYPTGLFIDTNFNCNQNCNFCFAEANERDERAPAISEILSKAENFKGSYIYLAGGEPTLREDLPEIIRKLKQRKFIVILATNGKKLVDEGYVKELKKAGLDIVQLQFDTLDDAQYEFIRNERLAGLKLKVIANLKKAGIFVYLWVPLIKGLNDDQIKGIIEFSARNSSVIKIVFFAPMWLEGRLREHPSITAGEIIGAICKEYGIGKDEFADYVLFDYYLSQLYQLLTGLPFFKFQPCTLSYLFLYLNKSVLPFSRVVDLKRVNTHLAAVYQLLSQRGLANKFRNLFKLHAAFFIKEFLLNKQARPLTFRLLRSLLASVIFKSQLTFKDSFSFQVRVEELFNRQNTDFDMLKHCNLYAYFEDELMPFCQREIVRKKASLCQ